MLDLWLKERPPPGAHPVIDTAPVPPPVGTELTAEYESALANSQQCHLRPFIAAGISVRLLWLLTPAFARVTLRGETYVPDPDDGGAAYVLPVRVNDPVTAEAIDPWGAVCSADIVDLLAFHPAHPARWALRTGYAEWLGAVPPQYLKPGPVPVWRSPLNWLRAGCIGIVPLSREPAAIYRLLLGLWEIAVEDEEHEAELGDVFKRARVPRIIVGRRNGSRREDGV